MQEDGRVRFTGPATVAGVPSLTGNGPCVRSTRSRRSCDAGIVPDPFPPERPGWQSFLVRDKRLQPDIAMPVRGPETCHPSPQEVSVTFRCVNHIDSNGEYSFNLQLSEAGLFLPAAPARSSKEQAGSWRSRQKGQATWRSSGRGYGFTTLLIQHFGIGFQESSGRTHPVPSWIAVFRPVSAARTRESRWRAPGSAGRVTAT